MSQEELWWLMFHGPRPSKTSTFPLRSNKTSYADDTHLFFPMEPAEAEQLGKLQAGLKVLDVLKCPP